MKATKNAPDRTLVLAKCLGNYGYPARRELFEFAGEGKPEEVFPKDGPNTLMLVKDYIYRVPAHLCEGPKAMFKKVKDEKKS